ncbi:hypothetical protein Tco_1458090 [Tanacetum coccineum]
MQVVHRSSFGIWTQAVQQQMTGNRFKSQELWEKFTDLLKVVLRTNLYTYRFDDYGEVFSNMLVVQSFQVPNHGCGNRRRAIESTTSQRTRRLMETSRHDSMRASTIGSYINQSLRLLFVNGLPLFLQTIAQDAPPISPFTVTRTSASSIIPSSFDEYGDVRKTKARLFANGISSGRKCIDFEESFAPVARIRPTEYSLPISLVRSPEGFEYQETPNSRLSSEKALYGLKQAPWAWK